MCSSMTNYMIGKESYYNHSRIYGSIPHSYFTQFIHLFVFQFVCIFEAICVYFEIQSVKLNNFIIIPSLVLKWIFR